MMRYVLLVALVGLTSLPAWQAVGERAREVIAGDAHAALPGRIGSRSEAGTLGTLAHWSRRAEQLLDYYPLDHANLTVVDGALDLRELRKPMALRPALGKAGRVGRTDEISPLRDTVLTVPQGLDGYFDASPNARAAGGLLDIDVDRAARQHAALVSYLLDHGVRVRLMSQPDDVTEAVYNTDVLTGIGRAAVTGNPKLDVRRNELARYRGADLALSRFASQESSIEFGDVLLFDDGRGTTHVLQGYSSMRANEKSVRAMAIALQRLQRQGRLGRFEHHPIELAGRGDEILHLDYVIGYAGDAARRTLIAYPEGLAGGETKLRELQDLLGAQHTILIDEGEMLAAGANLSNLNPSTVLYVDSPKTARIADALETNNLQVARFAYDEMTKKDGAIHCSIGQLCRSVAR